MLAAVIGRQFVEWISQNGTTRALFIFSFCGLSACGSGGGADASIGSSNSGTSYVAGVYMPAAQFKGQCAAPRPGNANDHPGTTLTENLYLRSYTNDTYLWYREVPDRNPAGYSTASYFNELKTSAITASGRAKDRYHFTYPTSVWEALSQSGVEASYGVEWAVLSTTVPRKFTVAYIHPNSPASRMGQPLARGEQIESIDGISVDSMPLAQIGDALYPDNVNQMHSFTVRHPAASAARTVLMTSENVALASVQNISTIATNTGAVGYLQFNDHLAQSEFALVNAIGILRSANNNTGVVDLIIDMRYNGGGYLTIASELAYMIAGQAVVGQVFERMRFNDKNPATNPVTGQPLAPTPFYSTAQNFTVAGGTPLPTLNLSRVFVLTGSGTCSASESLINGLRGVGGFDVIQIGSSTCGKPYGFYGTDNCGTTYFTIQLQTINAAGFGEYADGFSPANTASGLGVSLPGCSVADDFTHALGDPLEGRLAAALSYRNSLSCPTATGLGPETSIKSLLFDNDTKELRGKSMLRQNRWD